MVSRTTAKLEDETAQKAAAPVEAAKKTGTAAKTEAPKAETAQAAKCCDTASNCCETDSQCPEVFVEYLGGQYSVCGMMEAAKKAFAAEHPDKPLRSLRLYVKPEDFAAYYVINEDCTGKLPFEGACEEG